MKRRELLNRSLAVTGAGGFLSIGAMGQAEAPKPSDPEPQVNDIAKYPKCNYCGMDRKRFHHSRMLLAYLDGTAEGVCSIRCAATSLTLNVGRGTKGIWVGDNASTDEIKPLTDENIANLAESDYFGFMRQNEKLLKHGKVTDYTQIYENNRLTLAFVFPLETPVDPRKGVFDYRVYDPDYFIDFGYVKDDPVELEGTLPAGCSWELKPMMTDEELEAKRNFLAQQPVDWVNQTGEDFGSLFARPVVVTCKS